MGAMASATYIAYVAEHTMRDTMKKDTMYARYAQQEYGNTSWNKLKPCSLTNQTAPTRFITRTQKTQPNMATTMPSTSTNYTAGIPLCKSRTM